jgi:hypothetical protein
MKLSDKYITYGFLVAGATNMLVLLFSRFFTNTTINRYDSSVMSNFGLLMIVVWGCAYIAVSKSYRQVPWLVAVFALEKFCYGYVWIQWLLENSVTQVYNKDTFAGIFFAIYGAADWAFFLFFSVVFLKLKSNKNSN